MLDVDGGRGLNSMAFLLNRFVESSLDRMQKAIRKKQNIEVEEALLKEVSCSHVLAN